MLAERSPLRHVRRRLFAEVRALPWMGVGGTHCVDWTQAGYQFPASIQNGSERGLMIRAFADSLGEGGGCACGSHPDSGKYGDVFRDGNKW